MTKKYFLFFLLFIFFSSCQGQINNRYRKVAEITVECPDFKKVYVADKEKFLNDLKLSPYWKVEKNKDGTFKAYARSIERFMSVDDVRKTNFIFEFSSSLSANPNESFSIGNGIDHFSASIVFYRPDNGTTSFIKRKEASKLIVYDSYESSLGLNSFSQLAIKLSQKDDIYLILSEFGNDPKRQKTRDMLPVLMEQMKFLIDLPPSYFVKNQYDKLYSFVLKSDSTSSDIGLFRLPGMQERDIFYGFIKSDSKTKFEGINIKISHDEYCSGECTRKSDRLRKSEYLGQAYFDNDLLFFCIEDNAVYLESSYNQQFGVFSGENTFEALIEILDSDSKIIYKTNAQFKGWEN